MPIAPSYLASDFDTHFKVFHKLMSIKVLEILLVASPYDAYILEEDGSLASKIINEYSGLNLSRPPRITRAATAREALEIMAKEAFDLVITMPHLDDMDTHALAREIKRSRPHLPIILLVHSMEGSLPAIEERADSGIDQVFVWSGDADLLLAIVKSVEDRLNVGNDTQRAMVRVLLLVEDSPLYRSYLLPLFYKEVVHQTQAVLEESLNEEHRLLKMRARPKILVANTYEQAMAIYGQYQEYIFGVISDTRFPKEGRVADDAGIVLLSTIKKQIPDLPLLLLSTESNNRALAQTIPAEFLDKNSPRLVAQVHDFFLNFLGFGDFVFRTPDGKEVGRASNLRSLQQILPQLPDEPLCYHAVRNRFSNWIMARSEIALASKLRKVQVSDFADVESMRQFIISSIHALRKWRQKGVVAKFSPQDFDPEISDFLKIGNGSLGGKARGLAFVSNLLRQSPRFADKYPQVDLLVPKTLVITTEGFDAFVRFNRMENLDTSSLSDADITQCFLRARIPDWLTSDLGAFLDQVRYPLAVRSSSLLEDAHYQPFSGLYKTYMIPNNDPDFVVRLRHLQTALKLVYASTYFKEPRTFSSSSAFKLRRESMAVMIQQLTGRNYGDYFYPALSGVARSQNYYPIGKVRPEDGVAKIALGFGKSAADQEGVLRFCPHFPSILPQFSNLEDILANAQRFFYALKMKDNPEDLYFRPGFNLQRRAVDEAEDEFPVRCLASTYVADENRLRQGGRWTGPKVLTFAQVLQDGLFALPQLLDDLLELGRKGLGCPVEFEFAVNLSAHSDERSQFYILQIKPMSASEIPFARDITPDEIRQALCFSTQALGHGQSRKIQDIVYVKPDGFDPAKTAAIAREIAKLNAGLAEAQRPYLLIGPGRWGSFDPWLGIPVKWGDISGVGAIIELRNDQLKADPSHGTHFFQHITSRGLPYLTVTEGQTEFVRWNRLDGYPPVQATDFLKHVRLDRPLLVKCDGRTSRCVIAEEDAACQPSD
jgi:CheY-like chemotaxis protein